MSGIDQSFLTMGKKREEEEKERKEKKEKRRRKLTLETYTAAFNSWITIHGNQPSDSTTGCFCVFMNNAMCWVNAFLRLETGS